MNLEENSKIISISKDTLASLPVASYEGKIVLVDSEEGALKAAEQLRKENVIGFDTETKPSFKRGQSHNVALLQLSSDSTCYLFRLNHIGLPEPIKEILENEKITKVGLSIHDDFHNLNKVFTIDPAGFIDLQSYVKHFKIIDNSLARIYGIIFGKRISKGQRLTNWEADELTANQQAYAALDAVACVQIYEHLNSGNFDIYSSPYLQDPVITPNKEDKQEDSVRDI